MVCIWGQFGLKIRISLQFDFNISILFLNSIPGYIKYEFNNLILLIVWGLWMIVARIGIYYRINALKNNGNVHLHRMMKAIN